MKTSEFDEVFDKQFHELTALEREEMKELFSTEEEFVQMKMMLQSINQSIRAEQVLEPSPKIKESLDSLFVQTYQSKGLLWYNKVGMFFIHPDKNWHQQNILRIAAIFIVALLCLPLLPVQDQTGNQMAQVSSEHNEEQTADKAKEFKAETSLSDGVASNDAVKISEDQKAILPAFEPVNMAADQEEFSFDAAAPLTTSSADFALDKIVEAESSVGVFAHPDGIYKEVKDVKKDLPTFKVKDNLFVLDVLTAAY